MADYRSFKEIKNRYMRISIPLLLLSLLTIGAGLYAIINSSPERTYHWLDIVFALVIIVSGAIGIIGALHRYKELPEGDYCCHPGRMTPISPVGSLCLYFFSALLLYGYYNTNDLSLGGVLFFGVVQAILFFLSMAGFFYSRTFGVVGAGDKFYILGIKGIEEHQFSEIARVTTKTHNSYKIFNRDNKYWFKILSLWPDAKKLMKSLEDHLSPLSE